MGMNLIGELRDYWQQRGIANPILPSREDVTAFEQRYRVTLPTALADYFLLVNGTREGQWNCEDEDLISFWHLDQIRTIRELDPTEAIAGADRLFVFADWSIDAHAWAVRLSSDARSSTPVLITCGSLQEVSPTFEDFLTGYMARARWALFSEPHAGT
jgi:hypothetical protein